MVDVHDGEAPALAVGRYGQDVGNHQRGDEGGIGAAHDYAPSLVEIALGLGGVAIAGLILNRVGGARHEGKLRRAVEHYTDVPVIGAVGRHAEIEIPERHLGLAPANEEPAARERVGRIAAIAAAGTRRRRYPAPARRARLRPPKATGGVNLALDVTHVGAFIAGLLSFLSPCVLPLVPPYLCFLGGVALNEIAGEGSLAARQQRRVAVMASAFVAGFATVFVALGATASWLGRLVYSHLDVLANVAGIVILVMGLHFLGLMRIPIFDREVRFHPASRPLGLIGAYVVGLAFAFGWTPCIGPVLATILLIAGAENSVASGAVLLATYAAGIGIPFLIAAFAARPFVAFLKRAKRGVAIAEKTMGALLVVTGVLFMAGAMPEIAGWLLQTFPTLGLIG